MSRPSSSKLDTEAEADAEPDADAESDAESEADTDEDEDDAGTDPGTDTHYDSEEYDQEGVPVWSEQERVTFEENWNRSEIGDYRRRPDLRPLMENAMKGQNTENGGFMQYCEVCGYRNCYSPAGWGNNPRDNVNSVVTLLTDAEEFIRKLSTENARLKEELATERTYRPGGPGFHEAEAEFRTLSGRAPSVAGEKIEGID